MKAKTQVSLGAAINTEHHLGDCRFRPLAESISIIVEQDVEIPPAEQSIAPPAITDIFTDGCHKVSVCTHWTRLDSHRETCLLGTWKKGGKEGRRLR